MDKKNLYNISFGFVIFGAISYGIYGLIGYDIIDYVFGDNLSVIAEIIDLLIGLGGAYLLYVYLSTNKSGSKK